MKKDELIYWTPRILSILFILFLAIFSLDVFEQGSSFWETVIGLFVHNIPSIVLSIVLIISWRREVVGGIVFISAGIFYILSLLISILNNPPHQWLILFWTLPISAPALLIGVLFLLGFIKKRKLS